MEVRVLQRVGYSMGIDLSLISGSSIPLARLSLGVLQIGRESGWQHRFVNSILHHEMA